MTTNLTSFMHAAALAVVLQLTAPTLLPTNRAVAQIALPPDAPLPGAADGAAGGPTGERLAPFEEPLYEIVGRLRDGTRFVRADLEFEHVDWRSRRRVVDGMLVEQVYCVVTPVTETITVRVGPGDDVTEGLMKLRHQRIESGKPLANVTLIRREVGKPYEEPFFDVFERQEDGMAHLHCPCIEYTFATSQYDRDGITVEQIRVIPEHSMRCVMVDVPRGEDILSYFREDRQAVRFVRQQIGTIDPQAPPAGDSFEIVGRNRDGDTVLKYAYIDHEIATRTREVVRDGKPVEQVYEVSTPVRRFATVEVPAGQDVIEFLRGFLSLDPEPALVPEAPVAPTLEGAPPAPPAPSR